MVWLWSKADEKGLVRFVTPEARQWITLETNRFDISSRPDKHLLIMNDIYNQLLKKEIKYVPDKSDPSEWEQCVFSPDEIFDIREGTCLDLALLFCGICLGYELLPLLILIEGHALAAVSLEYGLNDWDAYKRSEKALFEAHPLTKPEPLRELIDKGSYAAIECTGFAHSEKLGRLSENLYPEDANRVNDTLSFCEAQKAGRQQLDVQAPRSFRFALDIAIAHKEWKMTPLTLQGRVMKQPATLALPLATIDTEEAFELFDQFMQPASQIKILRLTGQDNIGKTHLLTKIFPKHSEETYGSRYIIFDFCDHDPLSYTIHDLMHQACRKFGSHICNSYSTAYQDWIKRRQKRSIPELLTKFSRFNIFDKSDSNINDEWDRYLTTQFVNDLATLNDKPLLLLFNNLDSTSKPIQTWLMDLLEALSSLAHVRVVMAGRTLPEAKSNYASICRDYQLMPVKEIISYIRYCKVNHVALPKRSIIDLARAAHYVPGNFVSLVIPTFVEGSV